eukprot:4694008-Pleurochrysis_carterae.AAC.1
MVNGYNTEEEELANIEIDIERQEGLREVEKFVRGLRNGEIVGGPASERRMRHATREGNRPSFWTYLKVSGCRGCLKQEEEETIHHVLSGRCEGIGRNKNNRYRIEMKNALNKYGKLMDDVNNREGVVQANKALRALELPRRQTDPMLKEEEELALRQVLSGIIPEWQDTDNKRKKGAVVVLGTWTGEMMNMARMQMKTWVTKKNESKAGVQKRWDNRGKTYMAFQRWKRGIVHNHNPQTEGTEEGEGRTEKEKTYGIKHWGRVRTIPRIHLQVKKFLQMGIG